MDILEAFDYNASPLKDLNYTEAALRLKGFYSWLINTDATKSIIENLFEKFDVEKLLPMPEKGGRPIPPQASTPEEIAAVGLRFLEGIHDKKVDPIQISGQFNITPPFQTSRVQDHFNEVFKRFIEPAIIFVRSQLEAQNSSSQRKTGSIDQKLSHPLEITQSLEKFRNENPEFECNAFVMMRFGSTDAHKAIIKAIRETLKKYGIKAHRADDKEYHEDLFQNVMTYMHGCSFGIAVFERLEKDEFNPNVSLEVGYMRGLRRKICLLKDQTLQTLQTDLMGKLYKSFDPQSPTTTIPEEIEKWLRDKDIISV
jgi:uncharacterized protein YutD